MAAPALGRATELQRFENTLNLARVGGAILAFGLGPFFPHLGLAYVIGLGIALLADAGFAAALIQTGRYRQFPEVSARLVFVNGDAVDLAITSAPRFPPAPGLGLNGMLDPHIRHNRRRIIFRFELGAAFRLLFEADQAPLRSIPIDIFLRQNCPEPPFERPSSRI